MLFRSRLNEILENLTEFGFTAKQLTAALNSVQAPEPFTSKSLEGFLYPAHYSFNKGISPEEVFASMVGKFTSTMADVSWRYRTFTPYELLTIASLVQTEGTPDVFGKVARVIYNRLDKGMALQFDSTVHYALNRRGEIRVSIEDTKVKSLYNTFMRRGLPPGPIGSPTRAAIDATLQPPAGDWLYFVTVKPRDTRFTSSYDQFLEWNSAEFFYKMYEQECDGGIVTFTSTHPKWSFAKINEYGVVEEVAEKNPISDKATVGVYFWHKGSDYVKYADKMMEDDADRKSTRLNSSH